MSEILLLIKLLKESVRVAYERDGDLISRDRPMEREVVSHIVRYMQNILDTDDLFAELRKYDLDSEYHTNIDNNKITRNFLNGIRPDLVLHKRMSNYFNKLVVEFKPKNTNPVEDVNKLKDLTNQNDEYQYLIGVSVVLNTDAPYYTFVRDGRIIADPLEVR